MRRSPTKAFFVYLATGMIPIASSPFVHFAVALLAICAYSHVIYGLLRDRGYPGDERGTEMIDSVYFLGFLLTMGVLSGAFLLASDVGANRLLESVGLGVILTLAGLAIRVGLSLAFGTPGGVPTAESGAYQPSGQQGSFGGPRVLSTGQITEIQEYVSRLDSATRDMATRMRRMAGSSEAAMATLFSKQETLRGQIDQWQDVVNHLQGAFGSVTNTLAQTVTDSLTNVGDMFAASAADFAARVERARDNLTEALNGAHAHQMQLNGIIARNLAAASEATENIQRQSTHQLQDLSGVTDSIARLAEDVRGRTQAIPNPADILAAGLQQLTAAAKSTSQALQSAGASAEDSARSFALVTSSAVAIPPSLRTLGPGVENAVANLRKEVERAAEELRRQIDGIDALLEEFSKLIAVRVKGIGK